MNVKRFFGTLRSRIFAALFAISLVPIAVLGGQGYHCAMQAVYELAHKHLLAVADGRSTAVMNWVEERTRSIETFATLPVIAELLEDVKGGGAPLHATLQGSLDAFRHVNQSFGEVTLFDKDWNLVSQSVPAGHPPHALLDVDLRLTAEGAARTVYGVAHGHSAGDVGLHVACSVKNSEEKTVGFLVAYLDLTKRLTPVLQDRKGLYKTGKVYIVSADDEVLTEPVPGGNVVFSKWQATPDKAAHVHGSALVGVDTYVDYKGNLVLGASIPIGFEGWHLVTEIDRAEALVWLEVLLSRTLATVFVTCVVVVLIAFWISRLVGKPLSQLMRVSHRIRAGHVDERLAQMDVTEAEEVRKAFNAMLDQLQEKQDELVRTTTLAYVGELTSSTVHEMRNPLSSIKMNLQALSRSVDQESRNKELGEIALQQAMRLEQMLTDLLSFGKPVELHAQSLSFSELTEAVLNVMGSVAEHSRVDVDIDDSLNGSLLHIDKEQMCRILTNLVGNALEAMPDGGRITLRAGILPDPPGGVELCVSDSGPGLSQEALQRSFQPFYTTKLNGTGLGLPYVEKIVELHGGTIVAKNRKEGGAAFCIHLPNRCLKGV